MMLSLLLGRDKRDPLTPNFNFFGTAFTRAKDSIFLDIMKLRYEVYCDECHFLNAQDYPDGCESDTYDAKAHHVAARNDAGQVIGTVRLVFAEEGEQFPFEEHCEVFPDFFFPPRTECAEVSRLVVRKTYRRRPGDTLQGISKEFREKGRVDIVVPEVNDPKGKHRRHISPQILLGMFREIYRYSRKNGKRYWFAAMEKGLVRSLGKMGFRFVQTGPQTDYYGPVATYFADLDQLEVDVRNANEFLARWFNDEPITLWLALKTWVHFKFISRGKS